jgi:hypothetical protein
MAFVKFTKPRARMGKPTASIWSRGQIGLNYGATESFKLNEFKYVVLYYDADTNRMGLEFTNDENAEGAIKLVIRKNSGISFSAVSFLNKFGVTYGTTRKFDIARDNESGLFVIDLKNPRS